jgi:hypothetical protein
VQVAQELIAQQVVQDECAAENLGHQTLGDGRLDFLFDIEDRSLADRLPDQSPDGRKQGLDIVVRNRGLAVSRVERHQLCGRRSARNRST